MPYGRQSLGTSGYPVTVLATDIEDTEWKPGGLTLDWSLIAAVGSDTLLPDGTLVKAGQKFLRFGQILCISGNSAVQTATWTGGPTGGSAIISVPAFGALNTAYQVAPISATASAQDFTNALVAVPSIGVGGVSVVRTGSGTAGAPYVYTMTFNRALGNVPLLTNVSNTFSGGTTPSSTLASTTAGTGNGLYGPFDSAAGDGRQNLVRGFTYILNETLTQFPTIGFGLPDAENP